MRRPLTSAVATLCLLTACAGEPRSTGEDTAAAAGGRPSDALLPVPEPRLDALEQVVREEMLAARAELEARQGETGPELARGFGELGKLYLAHSLLEPAAACFANARTLAPEEFAWSYYLGRVHLRRNDPKAARDAFQLALALRPEDPPTLAALGELALDVNDHEGARSRFQRLLGLDRDSVPARVGLGRVAAAEGELGRAVELYEDALRLEPEAAAVHYPLGLAYRELGELELARRHLEARGDRQPRMEDPLMGEVAALATGARVHLLRAGRALEAGRLDEGVYELGRAIELEPRDAAPRVTLGAVLAQQGDDQGAKKQFEEALRIAPDEPRAHYNLGLLSVGAGRDQESLEHFRAALAGDPAHSRAAFQLGEALLRLGRPGAAVAPLTLARELRAREEVPRLREATALVLAGRSALARQRLEEGLAELPESAALRHALARLLAAAPEPEVRDAPRSLALATDVAREAGLFEGRIEFEHAQTLALAFAAAGRFDRALGLQEALVVAAERDGRSDALAGLRENLELYRRGLPGRLAALGSDPFPAISSSSETPPG